MRNRVVVQVLWALSVVMLVGLVGSCGSSDPASPPDGDDGGGGGGGGGTLPEDESTFGAIDAAVENGDLTPGQGLLYKMQSAYEPDLLPEAFQGGDSFVAESRLYDDLAATLPGLPATELDAVLPYIYPAFYAGSWWDLRQAGGKGSAGREAAAAANLTGEILESWLKLDTADGHVRVWYEAAADLPYAQAVATAMTDMVWEKLTTLMGRDPLEDGTHGDSARYDFVIVNMDPNLYGLCKQVYGFLDLLPACDETPTYIEINKRKTLESIPSTVAHEFMHALQRSFPFDGCDEYRWLREATATWAMDYCYQGDNYESLRIQVAGSTLPRHFLDDPEWSLDTWSEGGSPYSYGAYLFFQYLSKVFSPNWIRYVWQAAEAGDSIDAVDAGLQAAGSTDLEERWPQFSRFLWNQGPVPKLVEWDGLVEFPTMAVGTIPATVSSSSFSDSVRLDISLPRMSSSYYEVDLSDDSVSGFFFVNGWTFEIETHEWNNWEEPGLIGLRAQPLPAADAKGRAVELMYQVTGQDWVTVDLTDSPGFIFCRDVAGGEVDEAVLVFSNGDAEATSDPKEPLGLAPFLWFDNIGCGKWDGTLSWDAGDGEIVYRVDANYTWDTGAEQGGGFLAADANDNLEGWNQWALEPVTGSMTWTMSSSDGTCSYNGDATWPVDELAIYDQLQLRNFVTEGGYERTLVALLLSTDERLVTEVGSGSESYCHEDFTYPLSAWMEIPHGAANATISADGGTINVVYREYADDPVFELHLTARR